MRDPPVKGGWEGEGEDGGGGISGEGALSLKKEGGGVITIV